MLQTDLYPEERRLEILKKLNHQGRATVTDLSREFGVSEVTIRSDLHILVDQALIVRTHGGAVPVNRVPTLSLVVRRLQQPAEKDRIGAAAAAMVENGDAIFLDTSSTSLALARHLDQHRDITVITNSLALSQMILEKPNITLVLTGGILQRDTTSLIGMEELKLLDRFNIQKGFFGAHGLTEREGLTDVSAPEAEVKQELVKRCRQVIAILDSTKWGRVGLASFAGLNELNQIITDREAPAELAETASRYHVKMQLV